jgi:HlyD family secretion protein
MKKRALLFVCVVLVAGSGAVAYYSLYAPEERGDAVSVSGNIEVTEAAISFQIPGRLKERLVDEGDRVEKGQCVATLEPEDQELKVAQAQSNLEYARAVLSELEAGAREQEIAASAAAVERAQAKLEELLAGSRPEEIEVASADVQAAKAEAERLDADRRRYEDLYAQQAVSKQQLDAVTAAARVAKERLQTAEERLKLARKGPREEQIAQARAARREAEEQYRLVVEGPRSEAIAQARAKVAAAAAELDLAEQQLAYTRVEAPFGGVVLSKSAESGEFLNPGMPVASTGDLNRPWLRAFINETDLGRIKLGDEVEVATDSYPGKVYRGKVTFIASEAEFTPKTVQTERERVKLMYRIKVNLDNPEWELKPGMPADGLIKLRD